MLDTEFIKNVTQVLLGVNIIFLLRLGYKYYIYSRGYKGKVKQ